MKLIFAVVQNQDVKRLTKALVKADLRVTRISSSGGFLLGGNTTLMIGVEDERVDETLAIISEKSSERMEYASPPSCAAAYLDAALPPVQVRVGGATVFVLAAEACHRF